MAALLLDKGADPNAATPAGKTPLYFARLSANADLIDLLGKHGAK
jgi:ankyrin repeat protein